MRPRSMPFRPSSCGKTLREPSTGCSGGPRVLVRPRGVRRRNGGGESYSKISASRGLGALLGEAPQAPPVLAHQLLDRPLVVEPEAELLVVGGIGVVGADVADRVVDDDQLAVVAVPPV